MTRFSIRTVLAVVAFLAAASGSRALIAGTCGDYLQHKPAGAPMSASLAAESSMTESDETPLAPRPCSGPRCSQAPATPASLPAPATSTPSEMRGHMILIEVYDRPTITRSFWRSAPAMNYLYFAAEDIFHPPRAL